MLSLKMVPCFCLLLVLMACHERDTFVEQEHAPFEINLPSPMSTPPLDHWEKVATTPPNPYVDQRIHEGQRGAWFVQYQQGNMMAHQLESGTWQRKTIPNPTSFSRATFVEEDQNTLWFATTSSLWRSTDRAASWSQPTTPWSSDDTIERLWRQNEHLYAIVNPRRDRKQAQLWKHDHKRWSLVHSKGFMIIDYLPLPEVLLHSMEYGWLMSSRDQGKSWQNIERGPVGNQPFRLLATKTHVFAWSEEGIWRSDLSSREWEHVHRDFITSVTHHDQMLYFSTASQEAYSMDLVSLQVQFERNLPPQTTDLQYTADGLLAKTYANQVFRLQHNQWRVIKSPLMEATQLAWFDDRLWALETSGTVFSLDVDTKQWEKQPVGYQVKMLFAKEKQGFMLYRAGGWIVSPDESKPLHNPSPVGTPTTNQDQLVWFDHQTRAFHYLDTVRQQWRPFGPQHPIDLSGDTRPESLSIDVSRSHLVVRDTQQVWYASQGAKTWQRMVLPSLPCAASDHHSLIEPTELHLLSSTPCGVFQTNLNTGEVSRTNLPQDALIVEHHNAHQQTWLLTANYGVWSRSSTDDMWHQKALAPKGRARTLLIHEDQLWIATSLGLFLTRLDRPEH